MTTDASPRFLFDVMLARLCRYARAAGYDAELAQADEPDRELIARACREGRWLITLDRRITEHKAAAHCVFLLSHDGVDAQARRLGQRFHLDWLSHAFTRCLLDNTPLLPVDAAQSPSLPPDVQVEGGRILWCPSCKRVYWEGSHVRRTWAKLVQWQTDQGSTS